MRGRAAALASALVVALVVALAGGSRPVAAEPGLWRVRPPFQPRLRMRTATAQATASPPTTPAATTPSASTPSASTPATTATTPAPLDPLRFDSSQVARQRAPTASGQPTVRAQLTTGFALDGASPSGDPSTLAGLPIAAAATDLDGYARARAYGFGALYLGGRDLVAPGFAGYLAAAGRLRPLIPTHAPVASAWDQVESVQVGSAWAEAVGVLSTPVLQPLALRAGRQYVYGPYTAHLDGLHLRWHHAWFDASVYAGSRVPDWAARDDAPRRLDPQRGLVTGAEVAVDLRRTWFPVVLRARALAYEEHGHADLTVDARIRRTLDLTAVARSYDGAVAHEDLTVRYRLSDRARLVIDAGYRHRREALWDLALRNDDDATAARRYLDLGPRLPRATIRARAGTVLLDNVDLLVSGGAAVDARTSDQTPSLQAAGWLEGGGALEVRVRRTFALGGSGLVRAYNRRDAAPDALVTDVEDVVSPLSLPPANVGERSLVEGGFSARFSGGARTFSVSAEVYGRRTRWAELYRDDGTAEPGGGDRELDKTIDRTSLHGGGRVTLDAWITERVRLRGEYDVSSTLEVAPEIRGLKSLRIVAEGTL